ncbi:alpha/beta hydrolase [Variovorax sp. PCZ-1]|uniref:alpha/beta hydrolase n=1 Tax=Variovorax sp. PCZ-1 TaxID=2835533 RepID=UPI001BCA989E|nr:alpha/beta hydrolase [Variovorax sp. PCZ-1]MBS7806239.1 alpha/beta hydrolase [Variovorax sp. PCZ-1]
MTSLLPTYVNLAGLSHGAELNPQSAELLRQTASLTAAVPAEELTVARRRRLMHEAQALLVGTELKPLVSSVDELIHLPGRSLPARLYTPDHIGSDVLVLYFHGGGWVIGDLDTHHASLQFLAQHLGMKLLSVQYRKAPEHVFPAACDDAEAVLAWAHARLASWGCKRLAVSGDSAGGHLAAVAMHTHAAIPLAGALLFYPVTDMQFANRSYTERGAGAGLTRDGMVWFWGQFLNPQQPPSLLRANEDHRIVPMRQVWLQRPPNTVIAAAWHDPLYDEAVSYAQLLSAAGAQVIMQSAPDMAHGYLRQSIAVPAARVHVLAAVHAFLALI